MESPAKQSNDQRRNRGDTMNWKRDTKLDPDEKRQRSSTAGVLCGIKWPLTSSDRWKKASWNNAEGAAGPESPHYAFLALVTRFQDEHS